MPSHRQMDFLMKHPKALVKYHLTGQLPIERKAPSTPLRDLLECMPPRLRSEFKGIRLSPSLGFNSSMQFHTAEMLFKWLGGHNHVVGSQTMPYQSYINRGFTTKLKISDLSKHCAIVPNQAVINAYVPKHQQ